MKVVIVFESTHHGNTKKLVDDIATKNEVDLVDATEVNSVNYESYDIIGFASGVAFGKFYKKITSLAQSVPSGKKVFFIYSCGKNNKDFSQNICTALEGRGCVSLGSYGCSGYDTYGPLKLVGGINKGHPDESEVRGAVDFYISLL
ncbi:flavodoxin [Anaerotignum neopropionicum]|uniref:Flavodoxin n=1 Tax=Anaerotignum neopropionicum TaxID=36847 RepID=A0A136WC97_9FIRM|nr:flavodoxin domain-containing protein [Anaerotignum neopropionicum]KXL52128.1 flavodoxin [Anaerotignum neopropionicum]